MNKIGLVGRFPIDHRACIGQTGAQQQKRERKEYEMADSQRPNVTGKGPALIREMLEVFKEIDGQCASLDPETAAKIKSTITAKGQEIEPLLSRAYMKTVKAGETSWACKELAVDVKQQVGACNGAEALNKIGSLEKELDGLIHKVKTFVVRMT